MNARFPTNQHISCLSFGFADLSAELGCKPTWEVLSSYRSSLAVSCGIAGIVPIDTPFLDIKDPKGLALECQKVGDMGFAGKLCIHPSQLETVNSAFTPSQDEITWAQKVVRESEIQGLGAIIIDGRMIDKPVIESARRIVAMAELCSL